MSVCPSVRLSVRLSVPPLAGPQTLLAGPQTPPAGPQTPLAGPQTPLAGPQTPLAGPQTLPAGHQTPWAGPQTPLAIPQTPLAGLQTPTASEPFGRPMDGSTDRQMDGWTYGISPHSTGLCPLSGPLPCYVLRFHHIKEAGQGYR